MQTLLFLSLAQLPFLIILFAVMNLFLSEEAKDLENVRAFRNDIPGPIKNAEKESSYLGWELDYKIPIYFPDKVRSRHVHIIGATGSGKTESVLLNLINQDVKRGLPVVIIDAKGDRAFYDFLARHPNVGDRLKVFDSSSRERSLSYNPLKSGSPTDAVLRLFNSMTWSEEFYKTRARDTLLKLASVAQKSGEPLNLSWINYHLSSPETLSQILSDETKPSKVGVAEYNQLAGLISQVQQLCHGDLGLLISGERCGHDISISSGIREGSVLYFKLPALIDPVTTSTVGKLIIADLAYYAAKVQSGTTNVGFCPVFLDEFGSLACHSFLELIAKARSAGLALHFSHQSLGDLQASGLTFATQINDNSSTKIVMRVYDPDTADIMARTFGNRESSKETRQIVVKPFAGKEETGAMSVRNVKEFRADPDLIKSLPTGCAFVLMNHALRVDGKSSDVFRLRFPAICNFEKEVNCK